MSKAAGAQKLVGPDGDMPFEEAVRKLETIVQAMEEQDLPLEALLARYEEGARLVNLCEAKLNQAELKIQQLERNAKGEAILKPSDIGSNSTPAAAASSAD